MSTKFDPNNIVIRLCMMGMGLEENGNADEARSMFYKAWDEASDDFDKFIAAYFLARQQKDSKDNLKWLQISLQCALNIDDENVKSAYSTLYANIAMCYEALFDFDSAKINYDLSEHNKGEPSDQGPFYHGTKAALKVGDLLTAGELSNYKSELQMNHIYFTANINGAGLAAALAKGEGNEHVYRIEPTGAFENDPNVTDKKFPGNLTRSYRSKEPLRIVGEETEWRKLSTEEKSAWRKKISENNGEIIN